MVFVICSLTFYSTSFLIVAEFWSIVVFYRLANAARRFSFTAFFLSNSSSSCSFSLRGLKFKTCLFEGSPVCLFYKAKQLSPTIRLPKTCLFDWSVCFLYMFKELSGFNRLFLGGEAPKDPYDFILEPVLDMVMLSSKLKSLRPAKLF